MNCQSYITNAQIRVFRTAFFLITLRVHHIPQAEQKTNNCNNMTKGETVKVTKIETVENFQPSQWPSGEVLLKAFDVVQLDPPSVRDPCYWQSCARWALLRKYGYLTTTTEVSRSDANFVEKVNQAWSAAVSQATQNKDDLAELLQTGKSNHRQLQFSILDCAPGCQVRYEHRSLCVNSLVHSCGNRSLGICTPILLHTVQIARPPKFGTCVLHARSFARNSHEW